MKLNIHHLYYLFYSRIWIIIALLFFNAITLAQEQTPPKEIVLDGFMNYESLFIDSIYNSYIDCGFNTMTQRATMDSKSKLNSFDLHAINNKDSVNNPIGSMDWIYYYSSGYYSKWEAEEDQPRDDRVGVKHSAGETSFWYDPEVNDSVLCWSTKGENESVNSLVYGPSYYQEKFYKRWLYTEYPIFDKLSYTPRFRMALQKHTTVPDTQEVCRIYVILKYRVIEADTAHHSDSTYILKEPVTLKVSDFPSNGEFDYLYVSDILSQRSYKYPSWFWDPITDHQFKLMPSQIEDIYYDDKWGGTGVQFCIDWLISDTLCTLYIDNIEVYDNDGGNDLVDFPQLVSNRIVEYANNFTNWSNLKYWMGGHEPTSIDAYTPIKTIDEILQANGYPPLMNTIWALWNQDLNGELQLTRYYNAVQPNKLLVEFHPIQAGYDVPKPFAFEVVRRILQESYSLTLENKFYYHVQSYGEYKDEGWYYYRRPNVPEYKVPVMLALSHGADGLVQSKYDSDVYVDTSGYPGILGIINLADSGYKKSDLWYELKNNLIPRLKGKLGRTLMTLNYSGDYLYLGRNLQEDPGNGFTNSDETVNEQYLTLSYYTGEFTPISKHFHAGFFEKSNQPQNNYFLLTNLITTDNRQVNISVTDNGSDFTNTRFGNVEPDYGFDTTFTDDFSIDMQFPPGEGYLFQVAPVVEYGGRLLYPESVGGGLVLNDDMIIENGATLTIYDNYIARANIIVKNGSIINGENGKIIFKNGKKLIINGTAALSGTAENKLTFEFETGGPETENGIVVDPGASLTITYCIVEDAETGIKAMVDAGTINIQYVDFNDCITSSISLLGQTGGSEIVRQIKYCTITNSTYGISASNLPELLIQENYITNTDYGIYLSIVTSAQIIGNLLQSNREEMAGIYFQSSGGAIRANYITGYSVGIHIANSAVVLGSNFITDNKYHGLYIGDGSLPYMRQGQWIGSPPNIYASSGYNKIFENGGYEEEGGPEDNDGSEIYFVNSNAVMDRGCNSIYDDREPNPPLINTELLMNCPFGQEITINAVRNYWGETEVTVERFGYLDVNFDEYLDDPCPEPQGGGEDELVLRTSFGEVIDTVYSIDVELTELTQTEEAYAEAEGYFLTGDLPNALYVYEGIINSAATEEEKHLAYKRKYSIGKLTGQSTEYFNQLSSIFSVLAANAQDTLNAKILNQISTLSKVGEQEYEAAISEFDNIIQQNPNTEEAVYAEIDALTTALLLEETDSTLQKGRLGKYLVKTSGDYNQRVDEILRKNFGSESKETEEKLLPTEYTLYQNYPNPFNPVTTIKYDLPNASDVSLLIYDILGRKVKELVNTNQQAGRYEIHFDASNLASGVYIY